MPVSGLVVTLKPAQPSGGDPADTPDLEAVRQIANHPNFQAGELQKSRLPIVLDTQDKETDKACWGWLNELPGVHHVDVAFIHFEDEDAYEAPACQAPTDQLMAAPTIGET